MDGIMSFLIKTLNSITTKVGLITGSKQKSKQPHYLRTTGIIISDSPLFRAVWKCILYRVMVLLKVAYTVSAIWKMEKMIAVLSRTSWYGKKRRRDRK